MGQAMGQAGPGGSGIGGTTGDSPSTENAERKQGAGEHQDITQGTQSMPGDDAGDAEAKQAGRMENRSWLASLPEAIREAVKSRDKASLPKGFEELLRRYFEDQD